jgi:hypothetical protein
MILVSGTRRSGTSLWMQMLADAGFPVIGERFPPDLDPRLRRLNPGGFWESDLVAGIYWETNPHPHLGSYLAPEDTRRHAVKVFLPGLMRTDVAFIDACILTMRPCAAHVASVARLAAALPADPADELHPVLEWWLGYYGAIRDLALRRYRAHVITLDALRRDPEREVGDVLAWLGASGSGTAPNLVARLDAPGAVADPRGALAAAELPAGVDTADLALFDELYDYVDRERPLGVAFLERLDALHQRLQPAVAAARRELLVRFPPSR